MEYVYKILIWQTVFMQKSVVVLEEIKQKIFRALQTIVNISQLLMENRYTLGETSMPFFG